MQFRFSCKDLFMEMIRENNFSLFFRRFFLRRNTLGISNVCKYTRADLEK